MSPIRSDHANAIRMLAIDAIVRAQEGHQGVPLGMAEIATVLFAKHLKFSAAHPTWFDRDRFVLSNGHGSMLIYALSYLLGYERMGIEQIQSFRELGSHCAGHPEIDPNIGVEVTTGMLGQGIGNALGMAIAEAHLNARFGDGVVNHNTYCFLGDGCLQEGVGQEVISLAGHLQLGKLIVFWDDNDITDDGATALSISEDIPARFRAAHWHVQCIDGHDMAAIDAAISCAKQSPHPSLIACKTTIAKGLARLQGQRGGHSARLYESDALQARKDLNWSAPPFVVPRDILDDWRRFGKRCAAEVASWTQRINTLPPAQRHEFERCLHLELPERIDEMFTRLNSRLASAAPVGGINLSASVSGALDAVLPERLVACADLEAPTQHKQSLTAFSATDHTGRYLHCGVREHVMGALANGMAAHGGVRAVSVTYLAFADYQRPAIRMAAMMSLPVLFVFSHDSIGIGRNGPTHQPVEILASLRAIPNMVVLRPADAAEVVEAWEIALRRTCGPTCLVFARQALPHVRPATLDGCRRENFSARGAYVLKPSRTSAPHVRLLATGSEVSIACDAQAMLAEEGIDSAVVSMPSWELFNEQDEAYRASILGKNEELRIGIEAAVRLGWDQYLRPGDAFIGMSGFGASGSADQLYEHFGITAARAVALAKARVRQRATAAQSRENAVSLFSSTALT